MAKHSFGTAPEENDILEIQGQEYTLRPFGMAAFRDSLKKSAEAEKLKDMEGTERTLVTYELSVDMVVNAVQEDQQEKLRAHIENSVPPSMVSAIAGAIMRGLTDVDPTQPTSSSDGSSETGSDSTDGVPVEESTLPS